MQLVAFAMTWFLARTRTERGQDLLEYALLGGLIAAALFAAFSLAIFSGALDSMVTQISKCVDFKGSTVCDIAGP